MKKIFVILLIFNVLQTNAQTNVVQAGKGIIPQNSIFYSLPQTEIVVQATVKKIVQQPGPFANYAKRFLAVDNVITSKSESWKLENINILYNLVPDESKKFAVEINSKTSACNIKFSPKGIIEGVNISKTDNFVPQKEIFAEQNGDTAINFDYSVLTEDALTATSEAKMAEMAAKQIFRIRENRMDILSGESEKEISGEALTLIISELNRIENELVALFEGKSRTFTETKTFCIIPKTEVENEVLFRFSPLLGVVEKDNLAGHPITLTIKTDSRKIFNSDDKKVKKFGIFYNVPVDAKISVTDLNKTFAETTLLFPQFGYINFLPATLFDKKNTQIKFNEFGGIESIEQ